MVRFFALWPDVSGLLLQRPPCHAFPFFLLAAALTAACADGQVEPGSIEVISTPHKLFADAVRTSLLNSRYRPVEAGGHAVRQLVEQSFIFRLEK